jgi:hypothetical protein
MARLVIVRIRSLLIVVVFLVADDVLEQPVIAIITIVVVHRNRPLLLLLVLVVALLGLLGLLHDRLRRFLVVFGRAAPLGRDRRGGGLAAVVVAAIAISVAVSAVASEEGERGGVLHAEEVHPLQDLVWLQVLLRVFV